VPCPNAKDKEVDPHFDNNETPHLLVFSAKSQKSLEERIAHLQEYHKKLPDRLQALSHTLNVRREHLPCRAFSVVYEKATTAFKVSETYKIGHRPPSLVFVFTGQGAQWPGMGRALLQRYDVFRDSVQRMEKALGSLIEPPTWSLGHEICVEEEGGASSRLESPELSQSVSTAFQLALVDLLAHWGIRADAVVGHSSGEIAGAYAAGALTLEAAITNAYYRGQAVTKYAREGGMAAVGLGRQMTIPFLRDDVYLACENSQDSVTLSGDEKNLDNTIRRIQDARPGSFCRRIRVKVAYHSSHMIPAGRDYEAKLLESECMRKGSSATQILFYSTVEGGRIEPQSFIPAEYWRRNLEHPVLFEAAVKSIIQGEPNAKIFLEIGPHSTLGGPIQEIMYANPSEVSSPSACYVPTQIRNQPSLQQLLHAVGDLHSRGFPVDFSAVADGSALVLTDLPPYPWQRTTKFMNESRITQEWRESSFIRHELLGSRITEANQLEPTWRNILQMENVPWLRQHRVFDDIVFPCAGFIAMAGQAILQKSGCVGYSVQDLVIHSPLLLTEDKPRELQTQLRPVRLTDDLDSSDWYRFIIVSFKGRSWTKHCTGQVKGQSSNPIHETCRSSDNLSRKVEAKNWYQRMCSVGMDHGPRFQLLHDIKADPTSPAAMANVSLTAQTYQPDVYTIHPTVIDQGLQLAMLAAKGGLARRVETLILPTAIGTVHVWPCSGQLTFQSSARVLTHDTTHGQSVGFSDGFPILELHDAVYRLMEADTVDKALRPSIIRWQPHIDFIADKTQLIGGPVLLNDSVILMEKMATLCNLDLVQRMDYVVPVNDAHLKKYIQWLRANAQEVMDGGSKLLPGSQELGKFESLSLVDMIQEIYCKLKDTVDADLGERILLTYHNLCAIMRGDIASSGLWLSDDILPNIHDSCAAVVDLSDFFRCIGFSNPSTRILEISAGTGTMSSAALQSLNKDDVSMYSKYDFTHTSVNALATAKEALKSFNNVNFAALDITKNPLEQGFSPHSYDLIIAVNVSNHPSNFPCAALILMRQIPHETSDLQLRFSNARKLLAPGGRLLIQEFSPKTFLNFIMGTRLGWWTGNADGSVHPRRCDAELQKAGFTLETNTTDDAVSSLTNITHIIAKVDFPDPEKQVTFLYRSPISETALSVERFFRESGYTTIWRELKDGPPPAKSRGGVISLLELDEPFLYQISEKYWCHTKNYLCNVGQIGTLWVTRSCQVGCVDPRYSLICGFARSLREELSVELASVEVDQIEETFPSQLVLIYERFIASISQREAPVDYEYAAIGGVLHVPRCYPYDLNSDVSFSQAGADLPKILEVKQRGALDSLVWTCSERPPLTDDFVEVEVHFVGLNFKVQ
jgi:acyl transferase domain-containing protein